MSAMQIASPRPTSSSLLDSIGHQQEPAQVVSLDSPPPSGKALVDEREPEPEAPLPEPEDVPSQVLEEARSELERVQSTAETQPAATSTFYRADRPFRQASVPPSPLRFGEVTSFQNGPNGFKSPIEVFSPRVHANGGDPELKTSGSMFDISEEVDAPTPGSPFVPNGVSGASEPDIRISIQAPSPSEQHTSPRTSTAYSRIPSESTAVDSETTEVLRRHERMLQTLLAQEGEVIRYLGDMNGWLERDARDRHSDMASIAARLDHIQSNSNHLQASVLPTRGPSQFPPAPFIPPSPPSFIPPPSPSAFNPLPTPPPFIPPGTQPTFLSPDAQPTFIPPRAQSTFIPPPSHSTESEYLLSVPPRTQFLDSLSKITTATGALQAEKAVPDVSVTPENDAENRVGGIATSTSSQLFPLDGTVNEVRRRRPHPFRSGWWLAQHPLVGTVTLKRVPKAFMKSRRSNEAVIWRMLSHSNILPFVGQCVVLGERYLVSSSTASHSIMEYLQSGPFSHLRESLLEGSASALQYLHSLRIKHGAVCTANILVSQDSRALLCNFESSTRQRTETKLKDDVFDFGNVIAEVLKGKRVLFWSSSLRIRRPRRPDGEQDPGSWDVAEQCWESSPLLRPTMVEIYRELLKVENTPQLQVGLPTGSTGRATMSSPVILGPPGMWPSPGYYTPPSPDFLRRSYTVIPPPPPQGPSNIGASIRDLPYGSMYGHDPNKQTLKPYLANSPLFQPSPMPRTHNAPPDVRNSYPGTAYSPFHPLSPRPPSPYSSPNRIPPSVPQSFAEFSSPGFSSPYARSISDTPLIYPRLGSGTPRSPWTPRQFPPTPASRQLAQASPIPVPQPVRSVVVDSPRSSGEHARPTPTSGWHPMLPKDQIPEQPAGMGYGTARKARAVRKARSRQFSGNVNDTASEPPARIHPSGSAMKKPDSGIKWEPCMSSAGTTVNRARGVRYRRTSDMPMGIGGFSQVWLGILLCLDGTTEQVAVKELRQMRLGNLDASTVKKEILKRLKREILIWMDLDHPNIVPLIGFAMDVTVCLLSPWYKNGKITTYIENHPECDKLKLLEDVTAGLKYLHSREPMVVHGDIKSDNVLVSDAGVATLIDFGLSRIQEDVSPTVVSSVRGMGNVRWMAPELFDDSNPKTASSDVYGFGCLALEVLTGEFPFKGAPHDSAVVYQIVKKVKPVADRAAYPALPSTDPLWDLMSDCWNSDPDARPPIADCEARVQESRRLSGAPTTATDVILAIEDSK